MHPDYVMSSPPLLAEELEEAELDDEMDEDDDDCSYNNHDSHLLDLDEEEEDEEEEEEEEEGENPKTEVHPCLCCQALFMTKRDLRQHVRSRHHTSCYWTCRNCGAVFADAELFKTHLVKVHKLNKEAFALDEPEQNPLLRPCLTIQQDVRECPECDSEFGSLTSLNLHRLRRHISKRLTRNVACPVCGEEAEDLTDHVRGKHGIDGVVCPHCAKILSKTCTLNRHIEQVHLNLQIHKPAACDQCGKMFSKKGHLDRHVRTIHMGMKEASEPCPFCGKIFSTKSSLEPHIEMVHKGVRKECPECGKVLSDLWKHMRTVHGFYRRRAKIPKEALDLSSEVLQTSPPSPPSPLQQSEKPKKSGKKRPAAADTNDDWPSKDQHIKIKIKVKGKKK